MHLDRLDISLLFTRSEGDAHAGLENASFDTSDRDSANTTNFINVLKGQTEGFFGRALGRHDLVKGLDERTALVPRHVGALLHHVVTVPAGDGDHLNLGGVVTNLLQEG